MIDITTNFRVHNLDYEVSVFGNVVRVRIEDIEEDFDLSTLEDGDYRVSDCLLLPYSPFDRIHVDGDVITVDFFFDDWYKTDELPDFAREAISFEEVMFW